MPSTLAPNVRLRVPCVNGFKHDLPLSNFSATRRSRPIAGFFSSLPVYAGPNLHHNLYLADGDGAHIRLNELFKHSHPAIADEAELLLDCARATTHVQTYIQGEVMTSLLGVWTKRSRIFRSSAALAVAFALGSATASANTSFYGTVTAVGTYGNGAIFIMLNTTPIAEPGCLAEARIDIRTNHPQKKDIYALALAARASGLKVYGNVNGCDPQTNRPTFDESFTSFIYLTD
jgi:hypothetical protein